MDETAKAATRRSGPAATTIGASHKMHHCLHREPPRSRVTRSARRTVRRSAASLRPLSSVVAKRAMRRAMRSVDTAPVPHARDREAGRYSLDIAITTLTTTGLRALELPNVRKDHAPSGQDPQKLVWASTDEIDGEWAGASVGEPGSVLSSIHVRLHQPAQGRRRLPRKCHSQRAFDDGSPMPFQSFPNVARDPFICERGGVNDALLARRAQAALREHCVQSMRCSGESSAHVRVLQLRALAASTSPPAAPRS